MQTPAAAPGGAGHSQTFLSMKAAKQCSDQQLRGHGGTSPNCGNPADPARLCSPSPTRGNCRCPWHENPGVWASSASRPESLPPLWADFSKNSFKFYFTHIKAWDLEHGTPRVWQISGIWRVTNLHKLVVKKTPVLLLIFTNRRKHFLSVFHAAGLLFAGGYGINVSHINDVSAACQGSATENPPLP